MMTPTIDFAIPPLLGSVPDDQYAIDEIVCSGCGQGEPDVVVCDGCGGRVCECEEPVDITGCRYSRDVLKGHRECVGDHSRCPDCNPD